MNQIKCRKSTVQEYQCQILVKTPFIRKNSIGDIFGKKVSVDACLVKELFWLWDKGIKTVGCCCGKHINTAKKTSAYIQVSTNCIKKMKRLGYKENKNYRFNPCNSFIPKTKL